MVKESFEHFEPNGEDERKLRESVQREREFVEREEERLELLEKVEMLKREFGHWGMGEYKEKGNQVSAANAALEMVLAVLRGDEEALKGKVDRAAFELGYRLEEDEESWTGKKGQERTKAAEQRLREADLRRDEK